MRLSKLLLCTPLLATPLLATPLLATPLLAALMTPGIAAQERGTGQADLRQELRKIVREEVRAALRDAMRELHGSNANHDTVHAKAPTAAKKAKATRVKLAKPGKKGEKSGQRGLFVFEKAGDEPHAVRLLELPEGHGAWRLPSPGQGVYHVEVEGEAVHGKVHDALKNVKGIDEDVRVKIEKALKMAKGSQGVFVTKPDTEDFQVLKLGGGKTEIKRSGKQAFGLEIRAAAADDDDDDDAPKTLRWVEKGDAKARDFTFPGGRGKVLWHQDGNVQVEVLHESNDDDHSPKVLHWVGKGDKGGHGLPNKAVEIDGKVHSFTFPGGKGQAMIRVEHDDDDEKKSESKKSGVKQNVERKLRRVRI